jgi:D-sedoheptulose 7-phosphate isomerase
MNIDEATAATMLSEALDGSIRTKESLRQDPGPSVEVAMRIADAYRDGRQMLLFGNGGSAADAQHIAAEFVGRFGFDRPALPAAALTVNTSVLTALGNDYGFENVFSRQIEALGREGDVALGISTSGGSVNVVNALLAARDRGLVTVALTGARGGAAADAAEYAIRVPAEETPRVQEGHILIAHFWCDVVERALFG